MARFHFKLSDGRYTMAVEEGPYRDRQFWSITVSKGKCSLLAFEVGEPLCRTAGYGPVEAETAAAAIEFMSEPSAWDEQHERDVCEAIGQELWLDASNRRDILGRVFRRHHGA